MNINFLKISIETLIIIATKNRLDTENLKSRKFKVFHILNLK